MRAITGIFLALVLAPLAAPAPPAARAEETPIRGAARGVALDLSGVADAELRADLEAFRGSDAAFEWEMKPLKTGPGGAVEVYELTFPSPVVTPFPENNVVWCKFFPPQGVPAGARVPAVCVLHHLGGEFTIEEVLCDYLARSGVAALYVEFPFYNQRRPKDEPRARRIFSGGDLEAFRDGARQAVLDVRRAGDWLLSRPDVDPERLGVVGISLGAMLGSIVGGVDPRFGRNVLIIGGGDLPSIFLHPSDETRGIRRTLEERGLTRADIEALVRPIEPCRFAHRLRGKHVLMINADRDEIIPRASTEALWRAMGEPEIVWFKAGHVTIAAYLMDLLRLTRDHLQQPARGGGERAPAPGEREGRLF